MVMKWILTIMCLLLLCVTATAGEPKDYDPGITLWGLTADNADSLLIGRVGYETEYRLEVFGTIKYATGNPEFGPEPDYAGAGMVYHINEILGIDDEEPDNAWEELLHNLVGRPYIGGEILVSQKGEERARGNVIVGTLFGVAEDPNYKFSFVVEYTTGDASENIVTLGGRIKF